MGVSTKGSTVIVCVQGLWHLGTVTAACLASIGHDVIGLDSDAETVLKLTQGKGPLFEPDLDALLQTGIRQGKLRFSTSAEEALKLAEVLWVAFDTPVDDEDQADVDFVKGQVKNVLSLLRDDALVVVSSQLPVGSVRELEDFARNNFPSKNLSFVCSPENLRLGNAIKVFLEPDRIVVGISSTTSRLDVEKLFHSISQKLEWMSLESAEMTKHAINSFLAMSIVFSNEIAAICELVGADAKEVERGLKTEVRIGSRAYVAPGRPFAGGTLARDIKFLNAQSRALNLSTPLLVAIPVSNDNQKDWIRYKLQERYRKLSGLTVAVWGLTYKPGTSTLRRSYSVELCDWLLEQGARVNTYDPIVREIPTRWNKLVAHFSSPLDAVKNADVLVVGVESDEYTEMALSLRDVAPKNLVVIDQSRFLYQHLGDTSFEYIAVGFHKSS